MRILVLGSEGFIGSHTVEYFLQQGYDVFRADIQIKNEERYWIVNPEHTDFPALFEAVKPDVCVNATGSANVQFSFSNPAMDFSLNVSNVFYILDAIRRHCGNCKYVNLSSAAVYGNPASLPIAEAAQTMPVSPYGMHKLYSEEICREFWNFYNVPTISLRIFSAYGERLQKQLFWDLFQKVSKSSGSIISMFGTGNESRDFIYVRDLVRAIEVIINQASFDGSVLNVASGFETTIGYAVKVFIEYFQPQTEFRFNQETKIGDPVNWRADISALTSLGFKPDTNIETGIRKYTEWLKERK